MRKNRRDETQYAHLLTYNRIVNNLKIAYLGRIKSVVLYISTSPDCTPQHHLSPHQFAMERQQIVQPKPDPKKLQVTRTL